MNTKQCIEISQHLHHSYAK